MTGQLDDLLVKIRAFEVAGQGDCEALLNHLERAARLPDGQRRLVETFGASESVQLLRSLSFALAGVAPPDRAADPVPLLDFLDRLSTDDESTLINSLTALKRYRAVAALESALAGRRLGLWPLIASCLAHPSDLVHSALLDYLVQLLEDGHLDLLDESQLAATANVLREWCERVSDLTKADACLLVRAIQGEDEPS